MLSSLFFSLLLPHLLFRCRYCLLLLINYSVTGFPHTYPVSHLLHLFCPRRYRHFLLFHSKTGSRIHIQFPHLFCRRCLPILLFFFLFHSNTEPAYILTHLPNLSFCPRRHRLCLLLLFHSKTGALLHTRSHTRSHFCHHHCHCCRCEQYFDPLLPPPLSRAVHPYPFIHIPVSFNTDWICHRIKRKSKRRCQV